MCTPHLGLRPDRSATGGNILGNRDGMILDDPSSLASKLDTKGSVLDAILGFALSTRPAVLGA